MEGNAKQNWEDKYLLPKSFDYNAMDEVFSAIGVEIEGSNWYIQDNLMREEIECDIPIGQIT